jgi:hypothetical protein
LHCADRFAGTQPYIEKAAEDKARYEREYKAFREKNPEAPARPLSPYLVRRLLIQLSVDPSSLPSI